MTIETKIQIEALKIIGKSDKLPSYAEDDNFTYLTTDGFSVIRIPNKSFFLDKSKLHEFKLLLDKFTVCWESLYEMKVTNNLKQYAKGIARCFDSEKGMVFADDKLVKTLLSKDTELTEMFTNEKANAIYFAIGGQIYAALLPIYFTKEEN